MTSAVDICNRALSNIHSLSIASLLDQTPSARVCALHYDSVRDQILTDAPWGFANKLEPLSLVFEEVFNWQYAYQYPADCLHINNLVLNINTIDQDAAIRYSRDARELRQIENSPVKYDVKLKDGVKVIVSNEPELRADYRSRVEEAEMFPEMMIQAFVELLTSRIAISLAGVTEGRTIKSDALQLYNSYIDAAIANDANESYNYQQESDYITERY